MKNRLFTSLAAASLVAAGTLISMKPAQAVGLITPPPPDANLTVQAIQAGGAGTVFYLRPSGDPLPGGGPYAGNNIDPNTGLPTAETAYFDFRPPAGGGDGDIFFSNTVPAVGPFSAIIGTQGKIKDFQLPFLGAPITEPNLNVPFPITAFIDANTADATNVDTFDAVTWRGIEFVDVGGSSSATIAFDGFWNIHNPETGLVEQYAGSIVFSQALVEPVSTVISTARTEDGFFAAPSIQLDVKAPQVPEPSALGGLAIVGMGGMLALSRKRQNKM
jgi:hypothetical protein